MWSRARTISRAATGDGNAAPNKSGQQPIRLGFSIRAQPRVPQNGPAPTSSFDSPSVSKHVPPRPQTPTQQDQWPQANQGYAYNATASTAAAAAAPSKPDPLATKNVYNDNLLDTMFITLMCRGIVAELAAEGQHVYCPTVCSYEADLVRISKEILKVSARPP